MREREEKMYPWLTSKQVTITLGCCIFAKMGDNSCSFSFFKTKIQDIVVIKQKGLFPLFLSSPKTPFDKSKLQLWKYISLSEHNVLNKGLLRFLQSLLSLRWSPELNHCCVTQWTQVKPISADSRDNNMNQMTFYKCQQIFLRMKSILRKQFVLLLKGDSDTQPAHLNHQQHDWHLYLAAQPHNVFN